MDDQDEISSHHEELRHERLSEEEVEGEIDSLFRRTTNRNLWGRIFVLLLIVTSGGLFAHYYLHPVAHIMSDVADMVQRAVSRR